MSTFIANQISFSKDFKTFKLKGGDSNITPRFNNWTGDIPIDELYYNINGGMIELRNNGNEKICLVNYLVFNTKFEGNWEDQTDFFHEWRNKTKRAIEFNNIFIQILKKQMETNYSTVCKYIIKIDKSKYVSRRHRKCFYTTLHKEKAQKFTKYQAYYGIIGYEKHKPEIVEGKKIINFED
jgi:hypothetical protein